VIARKLTFNACWLAHALLNAGSPSNLLSRMLEPPPQDQPERTAYVVGTMDTKGEELRYIRDILRKQHLSTSLVDIATRRGVSEADISSERVAAHHPLNPAFVFAEDRGQAIQSMAEAFINFLASRHDLGGVIGLGGSGGSAIIAPALQRLRIGVPKILVSTLASGDVTAYVGTSDIQMINPVTDIAGLNRISRVVLGNAAHALAGMISGRLPDAIDSRPPLGLTVYGVTTPCVQRVTEILRDRFDCLGFHATSIGGRSLENLLRSGLLSGLIDITTSDIIDLLFGGAFPASENRLEATQQTRTPYVGSCGALDMINFREPSTLPPQYRKRLLYQHNPFITLVRTTPAENEKVGAWIGQRLNRCEGPVRFLIPEKGVSALDIAGKPFFDPEADAALFAAIENAVIQNETRRVERLPFHINEPEFGSAVAASYLQLQNQ
jgi:uncharacterized protein (UPF0261 family)